MHDQIFAEKLVHALCMIKYLQENLIKNYT